MTLNRYEEIRNSIQPGHKIHLIGICGVSMRPLGIVLRERGLEITGSDMDSSAVVDDLEKLGIHVYIGHRAENIEGADCIIRTAAVHNDNPEIAAARAAGVPVYERAEAWGVIMREYKNAICISGTHGKTTTTGMVTQIFLEAGKDPTVMIGGYLPILKAGHRVGKGDTIIAESCEYCNSFHNFFPTVAVINNVDADHLDFFKNLDEIKASFRHFAEQIPADGCVIANGDDPNTVDTLKGLSYISFGFDESNDVHPDNVSDDFRSFDVICRGQRYCHVDLSVYGRFNVYNALGACAVAWHMGIDPDAVTRGLAGFYGAGRRLEFKGYCNGAKIYDDYAHHPTELNALLEAVKMMGFTRVVVAFQPHTYTRTQALFDGFIGELRKPDIVVISDIYAARESNKNDISSRDLAKEIPGSVCVNSLPQVSEFLHSVAREGDIILTVGAGDIYKAGQAICEPAEKQNEKY